MFDGRVLDMIELGVEELRSMAEFPVSSVVPTFKKLSQ